MAFLFMLIKWLKTHNSISNQVDLNSSYPNYVKKWCSQVFARNACNIFQQSIQSNWPLVTTADSATAANERPQNCVAVGTGQDLVLVVMSD